MSRAYTLQLIEALSPYNYDEARNRFLTAGFIKNTPAAFERVHEHGGHVTGSAMVSNMDGTRVLLNKHGLVGSYMNFGGHADGDEDVFAVSKRELEEEAGITNADCSGNIFDIDVHFIAPHLRKGEHVPGHIHYDICWLYRVPDDVKWLISNESTDIRWFTLEEATNLPQLDAQMVRLYTKIAAGIR